MWTDKLPERLKAKYEAWIKSANSQASYFTLDELKQIRDALDLTNLQTRIRGRIERLFSDEALQRPDRRVRLVITSVIAYRLGLDELPICEGCGKQRVIPSRNVEIDGKKREISILRAKTLDLETLERSLTPHGKKLCPLCAQDYLKYDTGRAKELAKKGGQKYAEKVKTDEEFRQRRYAYDYHGKKVKEKAKQSLRTRVNTLLEKYGVTNPAALRSKDSKQIVECLKTRNIDLAEPWKVVYNLLKSSTTHEPILPYDEFYEQAVRRQLVHFRCRRCGLVQTHHSGAVLKVLNDLVCKGLDLSRVYPCKLCDTYKSKAEAEIGLFIQNTTGLKVQLNYRVGDREYDVFIPELNFGIEYFGEFYHSTHHVVAFKGENLTWNDIRQFIDKEIEALKTKYQLERQHEWTVLRILESEWQDEDKRKVWESKILLKLSSKLKRVVEPLRLIRHDEITVELYTDQDVRRIAEIAEFHIKYNFMPLPLDRQPYYGVVFRHKETNEILAAAMAKIRKDTWTFGRLTVAPYIAISNLRALVYRAFKRIRELPIRSKISARMENLRPVVPIKGARILDYPVPKFVFKDLLTRQLLDERQVTLDMLKEGRVIGVPDFGSWTLYVP